MNSVSTISEEWIPLMGKELYNSEDYVILKATDGSGAIIQFCSDDFRSINGKPHIRIGSKARVLKTPRNHPFFKQSLH